MAKKHRNILVWIKKQVHTQRKEGPCVRISLYHIPPTGKLGAEINRINMGENVVDGDSLNDSHLEAYAEEFYNEAESYADGIGETQTFCLVSYFEDDTEKGISRHAFRVDIEREDDGNALNAVSSEPANMGGMLKQFMRHNETTMRTLVSSFAGSLGTLQKQNDRLSGMVEKLWDDKVSQIDAIEELSSAHHQRQIELKREEKSSEMRSQLAENAMALLPAIANKMIGKKIIPETTDITMMQVVKLAETIDPDELQAILMALKSPEKKIAFVELLKSVAERTQQADDPS